MPLPPARSLRLQQVCTGTERTVALVKKYKIKMAFGTDILFSGDGGDTPEQRNWSRCCKWYTRAEVLRMATGTNAELHEAVGPARSVPGQLGDAEEGALADLLLVDG